RRARPGDATARGCNRRGWRLAVRRGDEGSDAHDRRAQRRRRAELQAEPSVAMWESPPLRASDAERDQVAASLREHCIAGRLTLDEFAERTDHALAARTKPGLEAGTRDLPSSVAQPEPKLGKRTHVTLIGGMGRRGPWRLPERLRVVGVIGAVELDLSEAVIEAGETTIDAWWGIGSLEIVVPEGI